MACIAKRRERYIIDFYDTYGKRRWKTLAKGTTKKKANEEQVTNAPLPSSTPKLPTNTPEPILPPSVEDVWAITMLDEGIVVV